MANTLPSMLTGRLYTGCHKSHETHVTVNKNVVFFLTTITPQFKCFGGARGVMVIVVGNEDGDTSSNLGRD